MNELTEISFQTLDTQANATLSFRERTVTALVWEIDEYGDRVQRRIDVPSGPEIFAKCELSETLLKALTARVSSKSLIYYLSRLRAHKSFTHGEEFWNIVLEDLCRDLAGSSEYAVIKACEYFRQCPDLKFFPDTAVLQRRIKDLDFSLRNLTPSPSEKKQAVPKSNQLSAPISAKQRRRVTIICKLACKPKGLWSKWEQRFFDAVGKNREPTNQKPSAA